MWQRCSSLIRGDELKCSKVGGKLVGIQHLCGVSGIEILHQILSR